MPDRPLVIAGAGIAGLALAAGLRRDGRACVVMDERPALGSTGAAISLWPNALAALDALGLGDAVRAAARPVDAGTIRTANDRVLRRLDPARVQDALGGPLVAVRRSALVELLHAHAPDVELRLGVAVRGHAQHDDGVTVITSDGPVAGSALVGADGYRSAVARTLGPLAERYAGYPAWRGLARVGGLAPAQYWGARREFGVVPIDDGTTYWYAAVHEPPGGVADDELGHLRREFAGWPAAVGAVLDAAQEVAVTRNDVMDRAVPRRWAVGRVALVGDAAHAMRPHLGQGGCQALVDAAVLTRALREHDDPAIAFAAYERRRRGPALRAVRLSRATGRAVSLAAPFHGAARLVPERLVLGGLARVAAAQRP